ncbi:hypothetical protein [Burkholderia cepacia]|uniref:hypothetical protein n=1 Tax=Burkholderia cepacia TaxID=292 RepID=UPI002ABE4E8B|nr:hypothetical protein [Burkholderia cepacia]
MEEFEVVKNQIIAGTGLDKHGENYSKQFFEDLLEQIPNRMPLSTRHDMGAETSGFLENFQIIPHGAEWVVTADVYIKKGSANPDLKGFSFSVIKNMAGNLEQPLFNIYLPYPHYNDQAFVDELLSGEPDLMIGKWIKKGFTDLEIGLIASTAFLILSPEWDIQYKSHVRPALEKILSYIPRLKRKGIPVDLVQQIEFKGSIVQIYFVIDRSSEALEKESTNIEYFQTGYSNAINFLSSDEKCRTIGAHRVKVFYDSKEKEYKVFHIQYSDGSDAHIA